MPSSILHSPSSLLLSVANRQRGQKINLRLLKQIAEALLAKLEIQNAELAVNLVAAGAMARLNEKFLHHAGSTDVITFDYADKAKRTTRPSADGKKPHKRKTGRREACPVLSGEIFICTEEAFLQARKYRTHWQSETVRYLIHGVLHLLGHDDSHAGQRQKMKRAENRLLRELSRRFSLAQLARPAKLPACTNR